ncbi:MAG: hypothetical protein JJ938_05150 [Roseicyclus sp.]|nr:hypothetical protein [Roseicyclus sp.]MBO6624244.1 hypothetical protein [Roseicyclus sp.]MBO6921405.1 hypothetical protein [Roseicyclus sp.]
MIAQHLPALLLALGIFASGFLVLGPNILAVMGTSMAQGRRRGALYGVEDEESAGLNMVLRGPAIKLTKPEAPPDRNGHRSLLRLRRLQTRHIPELSPWIS